MIALVSPGAEAPDSVKDSLSLSLFLRRKEGRGERFLRVWRWCERVWIIKKEKKFPKPLRSFPFFSFLPSFFFPLHEDQRNGTDSPSCFQVPVTVGGGEVFDTPTSSLFGHEQGGGGGPSLSSLSYKEGGKCGDKDFERISQCLTSPDLWTWLLFSIPSISSQPLIFLSLSLLLLLRGQASKPISGFLA